MKKAATEYQRVRITVSKIREGESNGKHYLEQFMGKARPVPDVEDIARRGGMPQSIVPYELGEELNGRFPISASGHSTCTVNYFVSCGLQKAADDVRVLRRDHGIEDPSTIRSTARNAKWMPDEMIERIFAGKSGSLYDDFERLVPGLGQWPPKSPRRRQGRHKDSIRTYKAALVAQADKSGIDPVHYFNEKNIFTRDSWHRRGCPKEYPTAFCDPKWKTKIQKELSALRGDLRKTSKQSST